MLIQDLKDFASKLIVNKPLLAIDYGQKKVGIAISDPNLVVAMPVNIILNNNLESKLDNLQQMISKYDICGLVVGLPINMNGTLSSQTEQVMEFIKHIEKFISLPIYLQDERLTSKAADNALKSLGMNRRQRNKVDDMVAAGLILETVLQGIKNLKNNSL